MDIISERRRFLRKEKGLNQADIAQGANVARGTYASYENGTTPPVDTLISLSVYYDVSIDYLTGLTNERKPQQGELIEGLSELSRFLGTKAPTSNDFLILIKAAVQYYQAGSPCGDLPIDAWKKYCLCLAQSLDYASQHDCAGLLDSTNAAAVAAIDVTKMPALMLTNKKG